VRERLLDDAVGGDVGARAEWTRRALDHELHLEPRRTDMVEQVIETREARLRDERVAVLVDAQHSE
jgi:hypothetical protein